ncbi:uncharacterized protein LOC126816107 [Patella vulgata]|uniref:uncharacterized protein LOC126816107 n=1 Tax=Patella vulgata TaxID=6465 RepID=UPI00217F5A0B|nr:uncharacterized protein LOC126816107 [Patella vulgata]
MNTKQIYDWGGVSSDSIKRSVDRDYYGGWSGDYDQTNKNKRYGLMSEGTISYPDPSKYRQQSSSTINRGIGDNPDYPAVPSYSRNTQPSKMDYVQGRNSGYDDYNDNGDDRDFDYDMGGSSRKKMKNNEEASEKMKNELQLREKQLMAASELLSKQTKLLKTLETNINKRFSGSGSADNSSINMSDMGTNMSRPDMASSQGMPISNRPLVRDMGMPMPDRHDIGMPMPSIGSDLSMPRANRGMPPGQNMGNMGMPMPSMGKTYDAPPMGMPMSSMGKTYDAPPMGMGMDGLNPPFEYDHRPGRFSTLDGPDPSFGSDSFPFEYDHEPGRFSTMPQPITRDYNHGRQSYLGGGGGYPLETPFLRGNKDQSRKRLLNKKNDGQKSSSSRQNFGNMKPVPEKKDFQSNKHTNQGNKNKNKGPNQQNKGANQQNKGPNQQNKGPNQQNKGPNQQNKILNKQNKRSIGQSQGLQKPLPGLMSLKSNRDSNKPAVTGNELATSFIGSFCPSCNLKIREPNHHLIKPHLGRMQKVKKGCILCGTGSFRHHLELEHHMSSQEHRRIRRLVKQYPKTKLKYSNIKTGVPEYDAVKTDTVYGAEVVEEMKGMYCHACDMFFPSSNPDKDYKKHLTYRIHHTNYVKYKKAKIFEELLAKQGGGVGIKGKNSVEEIDEDVDAEEDGIDMEMDGNDM